jgi:hypothetical protein
VIRQVELRRITRYRLIALLLGIVVRRRRVIGCRALDAFLLAIGIVVAAVPKGCPPGYPTRVQCSGWGSAACWSQAGHDRDAGIGFHRAPTRAGR